MVKGYYVKDNEVIQIDNLAREIKVENNDIVTYKGEGLLTSKNNLYTVIDYEKIIRENERQLIIQKRKRKQREKRREIESVIDDFKYSMIQKLAGIIILFLSIILYTSGMLYDTELESNDCTVLLVLVPVALVLLFAKNKYLVDSYVEQ